MAKTKISEFSATPANNTDIDSINIAEGCAPSGINDAIRELMAQLKDFQTGAVGDSFNGPIGSSTAAAGAFTTLSATGAITSTLATGTAPLVIASTTKVANLNVDSLDGADWAAPAALGSTTPAAVSATTLTTSSTVTHNGGTANGVTYLNGSKVLSSGSALTFDGTNFGLSGTGSRFINLGSTSTNGQSAALQISAPNSDASANVYRVGTGLTADNEWVVYDVTNTQTVDKYIRGSGGYRAFYQNGTEGMRLTSTGLGIGTSSPALPLHVYNASAALAYFESTSASGPYVIWRSSGTSIGDIGSSKGISGAGAATDFMISSRSSPLLFGTGSTERARITSAGDLLVGITTSQGSRFAADASSGNAVWGRTAAASSAVNITWNSDTSGDNIFETFFTDGGPSARGSITYNRAGGLVAYNVTSDYRAKDISGPVTGSGALIDSIPVYMGTMKGATQERPMFIAHEVPAYAHTGEKDAVDKDGNPVYQQMDASALIPVMWAEIQSLRQRLSAANL